MAKRSKLVKYAVEPEKLRQSPDKSAVEAKSTLTQDDKSLLMPVMTTRGRIRKVKVREEHLERYGKVRKAEAITRKRKVYNQATGRYTYRAVDPRKVKKEYIYDERHKALVRYNPRDITEITTTEGEKRIVTHQQKRHLYKRTRSGRYIRTQNVGRERVKKKLAVRGKRITRSKAQLRLTRRYTYQNKRYEVVGYSRASDGRLTTEEAKAQARRMINARITERHGISTSEEFRAEIKFDRGEGSGYVEWITDPR